MSRIALATLVSLALAGCVTPPPPPQPEPVAAPPPKAALPSPLPAASQIIPSRLDPEAAVERVRARLARRGFQFAAPVRPEPGVKHARVNALSARLLVKGPDTEPLCGGETEVVQFGAETTPTGSMLRVLCYTAKLGPIAGGASQCAQSPSAGCGSAGSQLVGEIAVDVISYQ